MNVLLGYHHFAWRNAGYFHERAFESLGHKAFAEPIEKTPYWTDWGGRLPGYIPKGFPVSLATAEKKRGLRADVYLELDGTGQYHLSGLKSSAARKGLWSCDIYREDKQRFHRWIEEDFDVIFSAQKNFLHCFKKRPAVWMPYAADPALYKNTGQPKIYDIGFVGNVNPEFYPERVKLIEALSKKYKVHVARGVFGPGVAEVYSRSKIVFNKSHSGEINMRVFETMACGTLLLTDRLKPETGLEELFQDGRHLAYYEGEADLMEKAGFYLAHDSEREAVSAQAEKEILSKHTYEHRFRTMLEALKP